MNEVTLIAPRGYCAEVDRAIETVERAIDEHGAPIYVRGEIVHNKHVVATLAAKGAVFVDQPEDVPEGARIILSAHGSAPEVYELTLEHPTDFRERQPQKPQRHDLLYPLEIRQTVHTIADR